MGPGPADVTTAPQSVGPSVLVAQLGARMHYAVPRILHRAGRLQRLYTDISANRGFLRALHLWPRGFRPSAVSKLLGRAPRDIPASMIRACTALGISYARQFARTRTETERVELYLRVGRQFGDWVTRQDWSHAGAVFVYNTAGLEVLTKARRAGLRTFTEQTIAPFAVEREILAQERARYPNWEPPSENSSCLVEYADRERAEWDLADKVLCGSEFVRESIQRAGGPVHKCQVLPYGVETQFEAPPPEEHGGPLRVLTVGAAGLRKGTPYAIEAARRLHGRAVFRWVGPFKMAETAQAELGPDVEFTGSVPRADVVKHYEWADVFFLPSLCEGSATATYEALTAGRPIVCTPNCGSVVRDGIEGYITPERDVDSMVGRLQQLADDKPLRQKMAGAARARAKEMDYETYARGLLAALTEGPIAND